MHHILIDRARTQRAVRHDAGRRYVPLEGTAGFTVEDDALVLALHEALERLSQFHPLLFDVVECRFFAGYSELETAEALGISKGTVRRDWTVARAWLRGEMTS